MQLPILKEMSPQWIASAIAILGFMGTAVGAGVRQVIKTNQLEGTVMELKQANLHTRLSTLEQIVTDIRVSMAKLSILDAIAARQELQISELRDMREKMVPRVEHESRWANFEKRLDELAEEIANK